MSHTVVHQKVFSMRLQQIEAVRLEQKCDADD